MREPFRILVVCLGNVCRSPLAEALLRLRLDDLLRDGPATAVSSAGMRALAGQPIQPDAAQELVRLGGDPVGFTATQFAAPMAEAADLVLTATREIRSQLLEEAPRALRRTFTLRELAVLLPLAGTTTSGTAAVAAAAALRGASAVRDYDVPDPIGRPPAVHREVADLIDLSCAEIAGPLARALADRPAPG